MPRSFVETLAWQYFLILWFLLVPCVALAQSQFCQTSASLIVQVTATPDTDPTTTDTEVTVGTTVHLTGVSERDTVNLRCQLTQSSVPFTWSLSLEPLEGGSVDATSSLNGRESLTPSFVASRAGTYHATIRGGTPNVGFATGEVLVIALLPRPNRIFVRRDISNLSTGEIASLRAGFEEMRRRSAQDPNDPTGLLYQANIHGSIDSSNSIWNQCQHNSFYFFSWHRMYLYYFERILRAASRDPNLTLPYWNYSNTNERSIPLPYRQPADSTNSLFEADRSAVMNAGGELPGSAVEFEIEFGFTNFVSPQGSGFSFGGQIVASPTQFDDFIAGELEAQPHNPVHGLIGGKMGDVLRSAQDPVFFLHHANVDRLWKRWLDRGGGRSNPVDNAAWMDTTFTFVDENKRLHNIRGRDILDTVVQLDYRYDDDPPYWFTFQPNVTAILAPQRPRKTLASSRTGIVDLYAKTSSVTLPLSPDAAQQINLVTRGAEPGSLILNIGGISLDRPLDMYYEIYVDLPEGAEPDYQSDFFAGTLSIFGTTHEHGAKGEPAKARRSLDITHLVEVLRKRSEWRDEDMVVTFVPRGAIAPPGFKEVPKDLRVKLRFESLTVTLE